MDCFKAGWMGLRITYVCTYLYINLIHSGRTFGDGDDCHRAAEDLRTV